METTPSESTSPVSAYLSLYGPGGRDARENRRMLESLGLRVDHCYTHSATLDRNLTTRRIRTIVVESLDTLARAIADGLIDLEHWQTAGVVVVTARDRLAIDLSSPVGHSAWALLIQVLKAFTKRRRVQSQEQYAKSQETRRKRSLYIHGLYERGLGTGQIAVRCKKPIRQIERILSCPAGDPGWHQVGAQKTKADPEEALGLSDRGMRTAEIAARLGVTPRTVTGYLQRGLGSEQES